MAKVSLRGPRLKELEQRRFIDPQLAESKKFMKFVDLLIMIVKSEYRKLGLEYQKYDFDATIRIFIRDMSSKYMPCQIFLARGKNGGAPTTKGFRRNDGVKFYYVPNDEEKFEIKLDVWLKENHFRAQQAKDFGYDLEPRIISTYINSLPDKPPSGCARYDTAVSVIKHHSPVKFETTIELYAYGKRYGFYYKGSDVLLKSVRLNLIKKGCRV